ncbi:hypothetical protein OQA88_10273 [Cercophora sp. LCS_1]
MATDEKNLTTSQLDKTESASSRSTDSGTFDEAWKYLDTHRDTKVPVTTDEAALKAIRRKIDWHLVPLLFLAYLMQILDKVVYNYAGVMTLHTDLNLRGNDFSNIATFLFLGQALFEIPNIYLIQKIPSAKYLSANLILAGIATAAGAGATSYSTLLVSRLFLGFFEATIPPSLLLISGQWYTHREQAPRMVYWFLGLGAAQILGGAVSYGFQSLEGMSGAGGVTNAYSATLIRGMGFVPKQAALINMPAGLVAMAFSLVAGIIGAGLMSFLPKANRVGILAGIYLVHAVGASIPIFGSWAMSNVAGTTKRAYTVSVITAMFSIGNIVTPQTFQARDAPEYRPARITLLAIQASSGLTVFFLFLYYVWQNRSRKPAEGETEDAYMTPEMWLRMTDKENKSFRYSY